MLASWRRLPLAGKIVLPYLLLTLLVGVGGTFVATRLVARSANDRLATVLVDGARRADAQLAAGEEARLRALDAVAARPGLLDALRAHDAARLSTLLDPPTPGPDWAAVVDPSGATLAQSRAGGPRSAEGASAGAAVGGAEAVRAALAGQSDAVGERQAGLADLDGAPRFVAAAPIRDGQSVVGALVVGDDAGPLAAELKQTTLADVVLYDAAGRPIASTLGPPTALANLSAPPDDRQLRIDELRANDATYQTVVAPLRLRGATVGAFALALPTDLVARDGAETRGQLAVLFGSAMVAAVLLGFIIAGRIARPIGTLAAAARALERGDLARRTGLRGADEIGALGAAFDAMAASLSEREAQIRASYVNAMQSLAAAVDAKDPYTHGHSRRVSQYAVLLARQLGLDDATVAEIQMGGLLHDVGKIGVPDAVLTKPGKLDDAEWAEIRKHPEIGAEILRPVGFSQTVMDVVLYHHERLNGRGFPAGLVGDAVPLAARIAAVCDAYDAMTSDRSYRRSLGQAGALAELEKGAREQFDAACVRAFVEALAREMPLEDPSGVVPVA